MLKQKFYWSDKQTEEQSIKEGAMISALIDLGLMYQEDIKDGKISPKEILIDIKTPPKIMKNKNGIKYLKKGKFRRFIDEKLKITDVAKYYGFKIRNKKIKCPFHDDNDPSLNLNDIGNCFYCFGCNTSGDIIEFIRRMEESKCNK